jgi:hypothetical protein
MFIEVFCDSMKSDAYSLISLAWIDLNMWEAVMKFEKVFRISHMFYWSTQFHYFRTSVFKTDL